MDIDTLCKIVFIIFIIASIIFIVIGAIGLINITIGDRKFHKELKEKILEAKKEDRNE